MNIFEIKFNIKSKHRNWDIFMNVLSDFWFHKYIIK